MANPPSKPQILLPDDLILEIFARADVNTIGRSRTLCSYWNWELGTEEFVFKHLDAAKKRPASIYVHFGVKGRRSLGSWVFRFNVDTGENERLHIPFLRNSQGQFEVIGTDNGCMAIRYLCISHPSNLIVWNPNTDQVTRIPDPMQHHCCICASTYAFLYFPDSVGYVWINIYKKKILDSQSWLTSYSSVTGHWDSNFPCPPYVQGVDSRYVVNHGIVYWLNWNNHAQTSPQCIVHFSNFTNQFGFILIPMEARAMIQRLLICEGCLYYAAVHAKSDSYRWLIWKIEEGNQGYSWELSSQFGGHGSAESPEYLTHDYLVTVKDTSQPTRGTQFTITKLDTKNQQRRTLKVVEFPLSTYIKSLNLNFNTIVPV
ncbi:hypothetical protein HN51_023364 [Arachis hypogaea]